MSVVRAVMLGLLSVVIAGSAHAESTKTCDQVIKALKREWTVVDYATPSKPTAMRVSGKYGHENSAGQIAYMQNEIKSAEQDCQSGNQQSALQRVSQVRDLMDAHGLSAETANAAMIEQ